MHPLTIADFRTPNRHPFEMLAHDTRIRHAYECEQVLTFILKSALEAGDLFAAVQTRYSHPNLVEAGYLQAEGECAYRLTLLGLAILHPYFKATEEQS